MEASVSNLTSPGDRVLVLTAGKFGERWATLVKSFGCHADVVEKPYGQTFTLEEIKAALKLETRAVFVQATESSTGVRHDIEAIAKLLKSENSEALLIVDGITGLGTTHLDMDGWGIDVLIGGSQKAVMMPPGLSYLAVSPRAWARHGVHLQPALLLRPPQGAQKRRQGRIRLHPFCRAHRRTRRIPRLHRRPGRHTGKSRRQSRRRPQETSRQRRDLRRHDPRRSHRARLQALRSKGAEAAAATAILAPEGTDSGTIVKGLKNQFAAIVTDGQGEMKGQLFRIAHIGFFDYMDTIAIIGALEQVIAKTKTPLPNFTFGKGLIAAQKFFAEHAK